MKVLIEGYNYRKQTVEHLIGGFDQMRVVTGRGKASFKCVGYFYNSDEKVQDYVYILPKVLLTEDNLLFGKYSPAKFVDADSFYDGFIEELKRSDAETPFNLRPYQLTEEEIQDQQENLDEDEDEVTNVSGVAQESACRKAGALIKEAEHERKFIREFAVWIYRAIAVYRERHPNDSDGKKQPLYESKSAKKYVNGNRYKTNTSLDVMLSLAQFRKENENFITYVLKCLHSGYNKIHWTKTISKTSAIMQANSPVYLNPINKKRIINFDEELIIIYFSILHYLNEEFNFGVKENLHFDLITGSKFKKLLDGEGCRRLKEIKYKYFSDTALLLWNLCYAFFDHKKKLNVAGCFSEYLLARKFETVFEDIIDELIGEDPMPDKLQKKMPDGKRLDHLYSYQGLTESSDEQKTYYIGDSKYYKIGSKLGDEAIAKQHGYVRSIIQHNINLWQAYRTDNHQYKPKISVRDEVTRGYDIIPNFFISALVDLQDLSMDRETLKKHSKILKHQEDGKDKEPYFEYQFEDQIFDRDTMLVYYYDVNFLYVLSLYARNNRSEITKWRDSAHNQFREEISAHLQQKYSFYPMSSKGVITDDYIKEHSYILQGKLFKPFENEKVLMLGLEGSNGIHTQEQQDLLNKINQDFNIDGNYVLGTIPNLPPVNENTTVQVVAAASVLACPIAQTSSDYNNIINNNLTTFVLRGTHSYGISKLKYFCPFVSSKKIQGYYEVVDIVPSLGRNGGATELNLKLFLGNYHKFGDWKEVDRSLKHPDIYTVSEITDIYECGIMAYPNRNN